MLRLVLASVNRRDARARCGSDINGCHGRIETCAGPGGRSRAAQCLAATLRSTMAGTETESGVPYPWRLMDRRHRGDAVKERLLRAQACQQRFQRSSGQLRAMPKQYLGCNTSRSQNLRNI
jgi:hypothetical protein